MDDLEIKEALISLDEEVTRKFFYHDCKPLFLSILNRQFPNGEIGFEDFVAEFYFYMMKNDAKNMRQFEGRNGASIYGWLKVAAIRYCIAKKKKMIEKPPRTSPIEKSDVVKEPVDTEKQIIAKMDMNRLFGLMDNQRYVHVIKRIVLQQADTQVVAEELNITRSNLYNLKKRAMASLVEVALKEVGNHEK